MELIDEGAVVATEADDGIAADRPDRLACRGVAVPGTSPLHVKRAYLLQRRGLHDICLVQARPREDTPFLIDVPIHPIGYIPIVGDGDHRRTEVVESGYVIRRAVGSEHLAHP